MKIKTIVTTAVATLAIVGTTAAPSQAFQTTHCSGSGMSGVWAGAHTSCPMARATRSAVQNATYSQGEAPWRVQVYSTVTHRYYTMHRSGGMYHHGGTPLSKWIGGGKNGSQITVFFWMP